MPAMRCRAATAERNRRHILEMRGLWRRRRRSCCPSGGVHARIDQSPLVERDRRGRAAGVRLSFVSQSDDRSPAAGQFRAQSGRLSSVSICLVRRSRSRGTHSSVRERTTGCALGSIRRQRRDTPGGTRPQNRWKNKRPELVSNRDQARTIPWILKTNKVAGVVIAWAA
jgi:hypothetical protein